MRGDVASSCCENFDACHFWQDVFRTMFRNGSVFEKGGSPRGEAGKQQWGLMQRGDNDGVILCFIYIYSIYHQQYREKLNRKYLIKLLNCRTSAWRYHQWHVWATLSQVLAGMLFRYQHVGLLIKCLTVGRVESRRSKVIEGFNVRTWAPWQRTW